MPLVIFKYSNQEGFPFDNTSYESDPLDKFKQTIQLPRDAHNKRWTLRSVVASRVKTSSEKLMRYIQISFPKLMEETNVMYFLKSGGSTPLPERGLRFYPNMRSLDQVSFESWATNICLTPNINLGVHRLDKPELEMVVTVKDKDNNSVGLVEYEVILEYE